MKNSRIIKELEQIYLNLLYIHKNSHHLDKKQADLIKMLLNEDQQNIDFNFFNNKKTWLKKDNLFFELDIFEKPMYSSPETCEFEVHEYNILQENFNKRSFKYKNINIYIKLINLQLLLFTKKEKDIFFDSIKKTSDITNKIKITIEWNKLYTKDIGYPDTDYIDHNKKFIEHNIGHQTTLSYHMICRLDNAEKRQLFDKMVEFQNETISSIEMHEVEYIFKRIKIIYKENRIQDTYRDAYITGIDKSKEIYLNILNPILLSKSLGKNLSTYNKNSTNKTKL